MLRSFKLSKVGFNHDININDSLEFEGETYIIRAIGKVDMGIHKTGGVWFRLDVVAQKEDLIPRVLSKKGEFGFQHRIRMDKIKLGDHRLNVGDLVNTNIGYCRVISILRIRYEFVDLVIDFVGETISELTADEFKKIKKINMLNSMGWEIYSNNNSQKIGGIK